MVRRAFPQARILGAEALSDGFRNANFKLQVDSPRRVMVLRVYEHDPSLCQKEVDLLRLVRPVIPVPEVLYAELQAFEDFGPFGLLEYVEGISLRELKRSGTSRQIADAAQAAGKTLAAIGQITFPKSGWLAPGLTVTAPLLEGTNPMPRFVDLCLASPDLKRRLGPELCESIHRLIWDWAPELASLDSQASLVHCDYGQRNLLFRSVSGQWSVAAVLDWEFAVSGSPLIDIGHFLRYERAARPVLEPHFSNGYREAGGVLTKDWRRLSRLIDLSALCEMLTHEQLPAMIEAELVELARATAEDRDPQLG